MKEAIEESSTTGSAKVHVQHTKNTPVRTSREKARAGTGTARKDTTTVQENPRHPGTREWA